MKLKNFLAFLIVTIMLLGALPKVNASVISISNVTPETGNPGTALLGGTIPATSITVTGQAEANDVVQIFWDGAPLPSSSNCIPAGCIVLSTGASGSYTVVFTVPLSTALGHVITAHSQIENADATRVFTVNPIIELTPRLGVVGTSVKVYGSGFAAASQATVTFDNGATQSGSTDSSGSLQSALGSFLTFTVPDSTHGPHDVRVTDASNNQARFLPLQGGPFTTLRNIELTAPQNPVVGSRITGRGTGFNSVESVTLFFSQVDVPSIALNGERALGQFLTDGHGMFPFSDLIPPTPQFASPPASFYNYIANDTVVPPTQFCPSVASSSGCANRRLALNPLLTLTPDHAAIPQQVSALGQGFSANLPQGGVTVLLQGGSLMNPIILLQTGATDPTGTFNLNFNIPSGVRPGSYIVNATDSNRFMALAKLILGTHILTCPGEDCPSIAQGIAKNPTGEIQGTIVTVHGLVFTPNSMVQVMFDGTTITTVKADPNGDFVANLEVPEAVGGTGPRWSAIDNANVPRSASATFTVVPWIKLDLSKGQIGSSVTVWGTGFPSSANAARVDIRYCGLGAGDGALSPLITSGSPCQIVSSFNLDNQRRIGTETTWTVFTTGDTSGGASTNVASGDVSNNHGSFKSSLITVPESWGGPHTIVADAVDLSGNIVSSAINGLLFRVLPSVSIDPLSGQRDRAVTLTGRGFAQWEHFITNIGTPQQNEVIHMTSLAVDFGPVNRYIDQAHFILNGQVDLAWAQGLYMPIALSASGTIIYYDSLFFRVGSIGSQFVKVPSLEPADGYVVTAYYFTSSPIAITTAGVTTAVNANINSYCKNPSQCDTSSMNFSVTSPEIQHIDSVKTDMLSKITDMVSGINTNIGNVMIDLDNSVKSLNTNIVGVMTDLDNSVKGINANIDTATSGVTTSVNSHVDSATASVTSAVNTHVDTTTAGVTHDVNAHVDSATAGVTSAVNTHVDTMTAGVTTNVNSHVDSATSGVTSAVNAHVDSATAGVTSSLNTVQGSVNTAAQGVSSLQSNLPSTVQNPLGYLIAVLAAIAAIGSIGAVIITSRRLKVAA